MTADDEIKFYASDYGNDDDSGEFGESPEFEDEGEGLDMVIGEEEVVIETDNPESGSFETGYGSEPEPVRPSSTPKARRPGKPKSAKKSAAKKTKAASKSQPKKSKAKPAAAKVSRKSRPAAKVKKSKAKAAKAKPGKSKKSSAKKVARKATKSRR